MGEDPADDAVHEPEAPGLGEEAAGLGHPGAELVAVDGPVGADAGRPVPGPDGGEPGQGDGPALRGEVLVGRLILLGRVHVGEELGATFKKPPATLTPAPP